MSMPRLPWHWDLTAVFQVFRGASMATGEAPTSESRRLAVEGDMCLNCATVALVVMAIACAALLIIGKGYFPEKGTSAVVTILWWVAQIFGLLATVLGHFGLSSLADAGSEAE